jgi:hypothetical protein
MLVPRINSISSITRNTELTGREKFAIFKMIKGSNSIETQQELVDTSYKRLRSLGELLHHWNISWHAQAEKYAETQSTTAWCAKSMSFYVQD